MRIARAAAVVALIAFPVALVGCTAAPAPVVSASSEPPPPLVAATEGIAAPSLDAEHSAAEAAQVRETGLTPPAQVYGGDCSKLYTEADLSELFGVRMLAAPTNAPADNYSGAIELHGGIRCQWHADDLSTTIDLVAVPDELVRTQADSGCYVDAERGGSICYTEFTGGWIRISGLLSTPLADPYAAGEQQIDLFDLFAASVSGDDLALPPEPAVGAWAFPVDCAALVAAADLSKVPGLGKGSTGVRTGSTAAYHSQVEVSLWGGTEPGPCTITGETVEVQFTAWGGARYREDEMAGQAGATSLAVAGLDSVYLTPTSDGRNKIDVLDGPNWLTFTVRYPSNAGPIAVALVAALDVTGAH